MTARQAAPVIRTPDQRLRVFVSSTLGELADERAAANDAIRKLHLAPVLFELGARPHPPRDLYRAYLDQSHIFIGIYWQSYGWVAPGEEISGLEDEYVLSGGKPKLIYVKRPAPDREAGLGQLLDRVRSDDTVSYKPFDTPGELRELVENDLMVLLSERFETPTEEALNAGPSNLPAALDRVVGRTHELEEVKDRLGRARLLTLVGTGGTGKTRLALEAATDLRDDFDDRVYFVDLAASRDLESVLSVTARAIGVREESNRPLVDDLKEQIGTQRMLLLLDNFEQVTAAAPTMAELLRDCPELKELVTSREVLHVSGENVFPVPPLGLPETDGGHVSAEQLAHSEAIQLFVDRAQAVEPDFRLTEENAPAVAELCVGLDGLPLAIELATARLGLFSPQALVERLGDRLKLLRGGARDAPVRQQTLRDTNCLELRDARPGRAAAVRAALGVLRRNVRGGGRGGEPGQRLGTDRRRRRTLLARGQESDTAHRSRRRWIAPVDAGNAPRIRDGPAGRGSRVGCSRPPRPRCTFRRLDQAPVGPSDGGRARSSVKADGR